MPAASLEPKDFHGQTRQGLYRALRTTEQKVHKRITETSTQLLPFDEL
jgi:hypothetical protein